MSLSTTRSQAKLAKTDVPDPQLFPLWTAARYGDPQHVAGRSGKTSATPAWSLGVKVDEVWPWLPPSQYEMSERLTEQFGEPATKEAVLGEEDEEAAGLSASQELLKRYLWEAPRGPLATVIGAHTRYQHWAAMPVESCLAVVRIRTSLLMPTSTASSEPFILVLGAPTGLTVDNLNAVSPSTLWPGGHAVIRDEDLHGSAMKFYPLFGTVSTSTRRDSPSCSIHDRHREHYLEKGILCIPRGVDASDVYVRNSQT